jgi:hypothetical protein
LVLGQPGWREPGAVKRQKNEYARLDAPRHRFRCQCKRNARRRLGRLRRLGLTQAPFPGKGDRIPPPFSLQPSVLNVLKVGVLGRFTCHEAVTSASTPRYTHGRRRGESSGIGVILDPIPFARASGIWSRLDRCTTVAVRS